MDSLSRSYDSRLRPPRLGQSSSSECQASKHSITRGQPVPEQKFTSSSALNDPLVRAATISYHSDDTDQNFSDEADEQYFRQRAVRTMSNARFQPRVAPDIQQTNMLVRKQIFHDHAASPTQYFFNGSEGNLPQRGTDPNISTQDLEARVKLLERLAALPTKKGSIYGTLKVGKNARAVRGNCFRGDNLEAQVLARQHVYGDAEAEGEAILIDGDMHGDDLSDFFSGRTDATHYGGFEAADKADLDHGNSKSGRDDAYLSFNEKTNTPIRQTEQSEASKSREEAVKSRDLQTKPRSTVPTKNIPGPKMSKDSIKLGRKVTTTNALHFSRLAQSPSTQPTLSQVFLSKILSLLLCRKATTTIQQMPTKFHAFSMEKHTEVMYPSVSGSTDQAPIRTNFNIPELIIVNFLRLNSFTSAWSDSIFKLLIQSTAGIHEVDTSATIERIVHEMTKPSAACCARNQVAKVGLVNFCQAKNAAKEVHGSMILLCIAVLGGRMDVVQWLLSTGINANLRDNRTGITPLHFAVLSRSPAMVRMLISHGAIASIDGDSKLCRPRIGWVDRVISALAHIELSEADYRACSDETSRSSDTNQTDYSSKRGTKRSSNSTKRGPAQCLQSEDWNDSGDDENSTKKRRTEGTDSDILVGKQIPRKFACLYVKFDQVRFGDVRGCGDTGYDSIPSLKDHLHKKHRSYRCERCGNSEAANDTQLNIHMNTNDCVKSVQPSRDLSEGFSLTKATEIRRRWRSKYDAQTKWIMIYKVLFEPIDNDSLPSPFFETRTQLLFENQCLRDENRELREIIRQLLENTGSNPVSLAPITEHHLVPGLAETMRVADRSSLSTPGKGIDKDSLDKLQPETFCNDMIGGALKGADSEEDSDLWRYLNEPSFLPASGKESWTQQSSADSNNIWSSTSADSTIPTQLSDEILNGTMQKPFYAMQAMIDSSNRSCVSGTGLPSCFDPTVQCL